MTTIDETRAVLERYARAWAAGDGKTVLDSYHDDWVLHYFGRNPYAGTHVGKAAAVAAMREISRKTGRRLKEVVAIMAGEGGHGCVVVRETFSPPGRAPFEVERAMLYRVADGKLKECWVYDQDQHTVDELANAEG